MVKVYSGGMKKKLYASAAQIAAHNPARMRRSCGCDDHRQQQQQVDRARWRSRAAPDAAAPPSPRRAETPARLSRCDRDRAAAPASRPPRPAGTTCTATSPRAADDILRDRAVSPFEPAAAAAFADHDLARAQLPRLIDQCLRRHPSRRPSSSDAPSEDASARLSASCSRCPPCTAARAAAFDHHGGPRRMEQIGHALGLADHPRPALAGADRDQQPLARDEVAPRPPLISSWSSKRRSTIVRGKAQRHFAQRGELGRGEEIGQRPSGGIGQIDLARTQPLDQRLGRQVDDDRSRRRRGCCPASSRAPGHG